MNGFEFLMGLGFRVWGLRFKGLGFGGGGGGGGFRNLVFKV